MKPSTIATISIALLSIVCTLAASAEQRKVGKEEIDNAAKQADADFSDSDYPFYSTVNGCGPDGWKNKLVPEKSHIWEGVEFAPACNQHDRDYMTLGKNRDDADRDFRRALNRAVDDYLDETVEQTFDRIVKRVVIDRVPRQVTKKVTERVKRRVKDSLKPWKWLDMWVDETRDVVETVHDEVKREVEETVKDVKHVRRASTLSPERIGEMKAMVEIYYQAVSNAGASFYAGSQAKQQKYETWVTNFLDAQGGRFAAVSLDDYGRASTEQQRQEGVDRPPLLKRMFPSPPPPNPTPVARCVFPGDRNVYLVMSDNAIVSFDPWGNPIVIGRRSPPTDPRFAWNYETPQFFYFVDSQGRIVGTNPVGQFVQVGHVTAP